MHLAFCAKRLVYTADEGRNPDGMPESDLRKNSSRFSQPESWKLRSATRGVGEFVAHRNVDLRTCAAGTFFARQQSIRPERLQLASACETGV